MLRKPLTQSRNSIKKDIDDTVLECPKLINGICEQRCQKDSDCSTSHLKCCNNGCGTECVLPIAVNPIQNHLPIRPLKNTDSSNLGNL